MTGPTRREELRSELALFGLSAEEAAELARLGGVDPGLELAAAALALAAIPAEPLPAGLADRLLAAAPRPRSVAARRARPEPRWFLGWALAAACLVLAVAAWLRPPQVTEVERLVEVRPPPPRPPAARREALLHEAPDVRTVAWSATGDPAARGASGDVAWSGARQQGFMRIRGLARNDPATAQYQLWIFDARRDERYPVDGGVFDVTGDEVVIPIHAAVTVGRPTLFAVTVERPGGVVVSKRERIVLAAAVPPA
jgi:hypothetical protein